MKLNCLQKSKLKLAGFTLVELMVTVAIMAIIAGLTFGNMNTASYRLKSAAKILNGNMQRARLLAVKENCPVYVDFDFDGDGTIDNSYTLWKDLNWNDPDPTKGGAYNDATTDNNNDGTVNALDEELIETIPLPNGISFGTVANGSGGPGTTPTSTTDVPAADGISFSGDRLRFSPQGTASSGWAYLYAPGNDEAGTHAVGTNNIGRVHSSYFATEGGSWN